MRNNQEKLYLGWRILPWKKALSYWDDYLRKQNVSGNKALEIGANQAGLSRWLADEHHMFVTATDLNPNPEAIDRITRLYPDGKVKYVQADATRLPFEDNTFKVVVMKSVLVSLGKSGELQTKAISEILRVLEPGGVFLFVENMEGGSLYRYLRKKYVSWAPGTRYFTVESLQELFKGFSQIHYRTFGYLSVINRPVFNKIGYVIDHLLQPLLPGNSHYIIFGVAVK